MQFIIFRTNTEKFNVKSILPTMDTSGWNKYFPHYLIWKVNIDIFFEKGIWYNMLGFIIVNEEWEK